jgi:hypothetical protein
LNGYQNNDFIGADMARKYLQMGFTRARRYTNFHGGRKYAPDTHEQLPKGTGDVQKAESAIIFYHRWQQAEQYSKYSQMKQNWKKQYG